MTDFNQDDENDSAQIDPQEDDLIEAEEDLVETNESEEDESENDSVNETIRSLPKAVKISEDPDENELVLPDDAEADLLTILESKIHAESLEDDEDLEVSASSDDSDTIEALLNPRRPDEQHCQVCWLLVRRTAPKCPEQRDDCTIFKSVG
jgi:hypothetical protein